ncbi:MAG: hypothetical protein CMH49_04860 [Myxococcales bacterium]|nr:hypothetical protein [Myxococcales bacterium]
MQGIFFDLDGTLLNECHQLNPRTVNAIAAVRQMGIKVCLASGRTYHSMRPFYEQLELDTPLACYNGAKIVFASDEIQEQGLPAFVIKELIQISREEQVHLNLYNDEIWFTERPESLEAKQYAEKTHMVPQGGSLDHLSKLNCTKALFIASPDRLTQLAPLVRARLGEYIDLTSAMSQFLEVLQKGVNKAWAIKQIAERLNIDLKQCLAFGDGLNDLEMIQAVAHGVAMQNAHSTLKQYAQAIAGHHAEDGVADYLQSYFGLKSPLIEVD